jgi:hypothetical protein
VQAKATHPTVRSNPTHEKQYDEDDQDDTDDTDTTVTVSITVAAEAATEATKQENNEDDNEDGSERHVYLLWQVPTEHWALFVTQNSELLRLDGNAARADIDLDAGCLLPFLVELMAEHHGGDDERGDDEVENVTIHGRGAPFMSRKRAF